MTKLIKSLIFFMISTAVWAQSIGDGSDGSCTFTSAAQFTKAIYNCTDITIPAAQTVGAPGITSPIQLRSRGTVNIVGDIVLSGAGTTGQGGGGNGGDCVAGFCTAINAPGSQSGEGRGGTRATTSGGDSPAGGGGSGGSLGATATNGGNGSNVGGAGGTAGTGGIAQASTVSVANLDSTMVAGVGGGAGGAGDDFGGAELGGDGGAGGGGISIVANDTITISGNITSNGANGTNGNAVGGNTGGGGGGGGSGGVIYIASSSTVTITGNLTATAGAAGTGGAAGLENGGNGGAGAVGIIRVDSQGGAFGGGGTANPAATQNITGSLTDPLLTGTSNLGELTSDIEYACAFSQDHSLSYGFEFFLLVLLGMLASFVFKITRLY